MKTFIGEVISNKMNKTATVMIDRVVIHPIYKKRFKRTKKYHVHDEIGVKVGETVKFVASKPYSKLKKWRIVELVKKNQSSKDNLKKGSNKNKNKKTVHTD